MKNLSKSDKLIISILFVWTLLHSYFLLIGINKRVYTYTTGSGRINSREYSPYVEHTKYLDQVDSFFPFNYTNDFTNAVKFYDYTEFLFYVVGTWLIFIIYKFIKGKKGSVSNANNSKNPFIKDRIELLKDLAQLRESGVLTEDEFLKQKKRILESD